MNAQRVKAIGTKANEIVNHPFNVDELQNLTWRPLTHYKTDVYHDLMALADDNCTPLLWGVRECGTTLAYHNHVGKCTWQWYNENQRKMLWYRLDADGTLTLVSEEEQAAFFADLD